jgi:hypothetical protein
MLPIAGEAFIRCRQISPRSYRGCAVGAHSDQTGAAVAKQAASGNGCAAHPIRAAEHLGHPQPLRLPIEDSLHDVRRQTGERQKPAGAGCVTLCYSERISNARSMWRRHRNSAQASWQSPDERRVLEVGCGRLGPARQATPARPWASAAVRRTIHVAANKVRRLRHPIGWYHVASR